MQIAWDGVLLGVVLWLVAYQLQRFFGQRRKQQIRAAQEARDAQMNPSSHEQDGVARSERVSDAELLDSSETAVPVSPRPHTFEPPPDTLQRRLRAVRELAIENGLLGAEIGALSGAVASLEGAILSDIASGLEAVAGPFNPVLVFVLQFTLVMGVCGGMIGGVFGWFVAWRVDPRE